MNSESNLLRIKVRRSCFNKQETKPSVSTSAAKHNTHSKASEFVQVPNCLPACLVLSAVCRSCHVVPRGINLHSSLVPRSLPPSERESGLSSVTPPSISPRMRARVSPNHTNQSYFSEKIATNAGGRHRNRERSFTWFTNSLPSHLVIL